MQQECCTISKPPLSDQVHSTCFGCSFHNLSTRLNLATNTQKFFFTYKGMLAPFLTPLQSKLGSKTVFQLKLPISKNVTIWSIWPILLHSHWAHKTNFFFMITSSIAYTMSLLDPWKQVKRWHPKNDLLTKKHPSDGYQNMLRRGRTSLSEYLHNCLQ